MFSTTLFLDHGTKRGRGVNVTPRPLYNPGKDQVPIVQEAGWSPGLLWTGAGNLAPTGIRSPDRPAGPKLPTVTIIKCYYNHKPNTNISIYATGAPYPIILHLTSLPAFSEVAARS
jgi:hypothetical protein